MEFIRHKIHDEYFIVPKRYDNLKIIGYGAFGSVCSGYDKVLGRKVAIKKLSKPFETDSQAIRTYREIMILNHMDHENVICLIDRFTPENNSSNLETVYFVTPLMSIDLDTLIKSDEIIDNDTIQFFMYQILRGLKYIHSTGITHRDLKPANIGINDNDELRILDLGLARQSQKEMVGRVGTRLYRAPEIELYDQMPYTNKVDIWSLGCIMWELFNRRPLFHGKPGTTHLETIFQKTGAPGNDFMKQIRNEETREYIRKLVPAKTRSNFQSILSYNVRGKSAVELLVKLLKISPNHRPSAKDAIKYQYISTYHDAKNESIGNIYVDYFEKHPAELTLEEWKSLVFNILNEDFEPHIGSLTSDEED